MVKGLHQRTYSTYKKVYKTIKHPYTHTHTLEVLKLFSYDTFNDTEQKDTVHQVFTKGVIM